ncbi:TIGR03435 family protein [Occallatibacter savannae]|uniref:TIGR03435 family protein n=1 Tax=Occallatibacter savannae TaxID=1002691 RepID=UPI003B835EEE
MGARWSSPASPCSDSPQFLSMFLHRTVLDKTGLTGVYDFELAWAPDELKQEGPGSLPQIDPLGASIFTAAREQLGPKLISGKASIGGVPGYHACRRTFQELA